MLIDSQLERIGCLTTIGAAVIGDIFFPTGWVWLIWDLLRETFILAWRLPGTDEQLHEFKHDADTILYIPTNRDQNSWFVWPWYWNHTPLYILEYYVQSVWSLPHTLLVGSTDGHGPYPQIVEACMYCIEHPTETLVAGSLSLDSPHASTKPALSYPARNAVLICYITRNWRKKKARSPNLGHHGSHETCMRVTWHKSLHFHFDFDCYRSITYVADSSGSSSYSPIGDFGRYATT